jgi:hypothetical protein
MLFAAATTLGGGFLVRRRAGVFISSMLTCLPPGPSDLKRSLCRLGMDGAWCLVLGCGMVCFDCAAGATQSHAGLAIGGCGTTVLCVKNGYTWPSNGGSRDWGHEEVAVQELGGGGGRYGFAREAVVVVVVDGGRRADQDETNDERRRGGRGRGQVDGQLGSQSRTKFEVEILPWMECVYPDSSRPIGQALALRCEPARPASCQLPVARYTPEPCRALPGRANTCGVAEWQSRTDMSCSPAEPCG